MSEDLASKQHKIKLQAVAATGFNLLVFYFGYSVLPVPVPRLPTTVDRLVYTLQWQTMSLLTLFFGIHIVAITRFNTKAIDPINGRGDHHLAVSQQYLQKTLEQLFLSIAGQMILSTYLSEPQMRAIPILVFLFVVGRITFLIGYRKSPMHRSFGFWSTWTSATCLYFCLCFCFLTGK